MYTSYLRGGVEWALMVALVLGSGLVARAQEEPPEDEGAVVRIGRPDAGDDRDDDAPRRERRGDRVNPPARPEPFMRPEASKYWIGLSAPPIEPGHPLRAHVDLPEKQGLIVTEVVPDSPADEAGLERHDILLRANDSELRDVRDLAELAESAGERSEQIALEVLRRGERLTVYVTPEERPADAPRSGHGFGGEFGPLGGLPQELFREFRMGLDDPRGVEFRNFGPGVVIRPGPRGMANLPNGVSVNIVKEPDQPTRVTVKRGGETWEVVGDDPESLEQLPPDLQPFVEQLLQGRSPIEAFPRPGRPPLPELGDGRLRERLERMEREIDELRERVLERRNQAAQERERVEEER